MTPTEPREDVVEGFVQYTYDSYTAEYDYDDTDEYNLYDEEDGWGYQ